MAKFNIEVELDWMDEEYNIDEEIKERVIHSVQDILTKRTSEDIIKILNKEIDKKITEEKEVIEAEVDKFLENVCEEQIAKMKIPYKTNSWSDEVRYKTMAEFVGDRYEAFLNRKVYDRDGHVARYESDKQLSINEYFIGKYLEKYVSKRVSDLIQKAKQDADEMVLKTLEQNLKDQLAANTIKQLNIPLLLENLQKKAIEFEG